MNAENILAGTASLFMALGDKTRLRLLNLMRDREICVSSFTGVLEQSQPLISRHLAYLRNSGIVEARRDGKWIHYSISSGLDDNTNRLLVELFKWMELQDGLRVDRDKYFAASGEAPPAVPGKQERTVRKPRLKRSQEREAPSREGRGGVAEYVTPVDQPAPSYQEPDDYPRASHNELEDFLL